MANPNRPEKRKVEGGGRDTPKGGAQPARKKPAADEPGSTADASSRYTPPVPSHHMESPKWVPILMFSLFGLGMLMIFFHYTEVILPQPDSNWWLFAGLGSILGGIITATQYR